MPRLASAERLADAAYRRWLEHRPEIIAFDTETTGLSWYDEPFTGQVSYRGQDGRIWSGFFELPLCALQYGAILRGTRFWIAHNAKFDLQKLVLIDVLDRAELDRHVVVHDTWAQAHLLEPIRVKKLKVLAKTELGLETDEDERLKKVRRKLKLKKEDGYQWLPRAVIYPYAIKDTEFTLQLHEKLYPQLGDRVLELYEAEEELMLVLLDIEAYGVKTDVEYVREKNVEYGERVFNAVARIRELTGDPQFNPESNPQKLKALKARGHKIANVQAATLKGLENCELASSLLEYEKDAKLLQSYLRPLLTEERDGIVHPNFNQHVARTGRTSSSKSLG